MSGGGGMQTKEPGRFQELVWAIEDRLRRLTRRS